MLPKIERITVLYCAKPIFLSLNGPPAHCLVKNYTSPSWSQLIFAIPETQPADAESMLALMMRCSTRHVHVNKVTHGEHECEMFIFQVEKEHFVKECIQNSDNCKMLERMAVVLGCAFRPQEQLEGLKFAISHKINK